MAEENKKDLTGILEFSQKMQDAGQAPPVPEGSIMEAAPIEKIDDFESLDEYAKHNPAAEAPPDDPASSAEPASEADAFALSPSEGGVASGAFAGTHEFPTTPGAGEGDAGSFDLGGAVPGDLTPTPEPAMNDAQDLDPPAELGVHPPDPPPAGDPAPTEPAPDADFGSVAGPPPPDPVPSADASPGGEFAVAAPGVDDLPPQAPIPEEPSVRAVPPTPSKPATPAQTMQKVRSYAERVSAGKPAVAAAFPFSLLIEGRLAPEEKERLLDLLGRENMGIRDLDLEPQLESGKILIPRISEYAGVLLVMALRSARCRIRLGPSDEIFATDDTRSRDDEPVTASAPEIAQTQSTEPDHPAESMPLTTDAGLPGVKQFTVIDVVTASATLSTEVVEAERSSEYQEIVEALQRELRYKAYRKGASAVLNFSIKLTPLSLPTHYRLMAVGSAVQLAVPQQSTPSA